MSISNFRADVRRPAARPIAILAPTPTACAIAQQLQAGLAEAVVWTKASSESESAELERVRTYTGSLAAVVQQVWQEAEALVFVLATGAVVRLIAPYLADKSTDPAVVVVDEGAKFAISLSGGHGAGGDRLTREVAALLEATPVISSASEVHQLPALDTLGKSFGWQRGAGDWLGVASAAVRAAAGAGAIAVRQTCGWTMWQQQLPDRHPLVWEVSELSDEIPIRATLWISDRRPPADLPQPYACWHPRTLWLGVGCERGTAAATIERAIADRLAELGLARAAVAGLASIALKADEAGLLAVARQYQWPLRWFEAAELARATVPNPSPVVERAVGTPSVAEAAALLAAESDRLVAPKQVLRVPDAGACTVAIARAECEYSPRLGQLRLVGIGPGSLDCLTPAARQAIVRADAVVGYQLYLDLVSPLLRPQQIVCASPITQEVQRADGAIALARRGLSVAVLSSGDCGIYGMAGLVLERLAQTGWDGRSPQVEVVPGITALQAAAARVGAPLMHDFCAISLSDLLTPWPVIERRLEAAAAADFVVALYNPRSQTRTRGIATARDIFLRHRSPATPVAIVRAAYRSDESIQITTLTDFDVAVVDMLSTVLIGNSNTFVCEGYAITPRGYLRAYSSMTSPLTHPDADRCS
ncbi:precorrin-3B C(17)-methyltransferase [Synechococcus sp. PCC 7336]|uniref:precorrin-3B C(17)-methyltransferase n=1 Tax=Synechococcus sp. PCC 7336 TaxID=195250 RepID=UPI00034C02BD|nr:precorrin-3B C(17)-methyltransferase [Synechococcus sp. PCC 7336]